MHHGFVDAIVPRPQMKKTLAQLIRLHQQPLTPASHRIQLPEAIPLGSAGHTDGL